MKLEKLTVESLLTDSGMSRSLALASNADVVVVDVSALERINATLLEAVVRIKKAMLRNGRRGIVRLIVRSPLVRRTLAVTGLGKLFEIYATLESAGAADAVRYKHKRRGRTSIKKSACAA